MLTQELLKTLLEYNPITGIFTRKISTNPKNKEGETAGTLYQGYKVIKLLGKSYQAARLAFLYMEGCFPSGQIDHINHMRDDDRWINLRLVSQQENSKNRSKYVTNSSGENGITKSGKKYRVQLSSNGKRYSFGSHETLEEAVIARDQGKRELGLHDNHGCT